jgi:hypothetical protein
VSPILGIYASQISGHLFAPSGAYDSIATVTVGAGGASTIDFTSIPSTYTHLQLRVLGRSTATGSDRESLDLMINSDNGTNYATHALGGNGSSASAFGITGYTGSNNQFGGSSNIPATDALANTFGVCIMDILDYTNTNKYKVTRALVGQDQNTTSGRINLMSGLWLNTAAITTLSLNLSVGNFAQYSSAALYGIRGN